MNSKLLKVLKIATVGLSAIAAVLGAVNESITLHRNIKQLKKEKAAELPQETK